LRENEDLATIVGHVYKQHGYAEAIRTWAHQEQNVRGATFFVGALYAAIGDKEDALKWLSKAAQQGEVLQKLNVHPRFDTLRSDVRFQMLQSQFSAPGSSQLDARHQ